MHSGATGKPCNGVIVCEKFEIATEKYLAILMDRGSGGPVIIGSKHGGMSIEDVAHKYPEAIIKMPVDIVAGLSDAQAREMAEKIGFEDDKVEKGSLCVSLAF